MSQKELVKSVEFIMDENKKVNIKSNNETFPFYLLGVINNNPDYQKDKTLIDLINESVSNFIKDENLRPNLQEPISIHLKVQSEELDVEEHTVFAFFITSLSDKICTALFDYEINEIPALAIEEIKRGEENAYPYY